MRKTISTILASAALVAVACTAAALPSNAEAAVVSFNFGSHTGNLGTTETYSVSGLTVTASGFSSPNHTTDLYGKSAGGDEVGLGLANDPSGDNEIYYGMGFVQLNVSNLVGKVDPNQVFFGTNSTTNGETWAVYGSNSSGSYSTSNLVASGSTEGSHLLSGFGAYEYYDFVSTGPAPTFNRSTWRYNTDGGNFLISNLSVAAVPEPATWAMMLMGFFGMGSLLRSRRKALAFAAV